MAIMSLILRLRLTSRKNLKLATRLSYSFEKILIVLLSHIMVGALNYFDVEIFSIHYSVYYILFMGTHLVIMIFARKSRNIMILIYGALSFIHIIMHFPLVFSNVQFFRNLIYYYPVNLSAITTGYEFMMVITGVLGVLYVVISACCRCCNDFCWRANPNRYTSRAE